MISGRRGTRCALATSSLVLASTFLAAIGPAHAADVANSIVVEADLSKALQRELGIELDGEPVELANSRVRMILSDARNRNQLIMILNDPGFDAPDSDEDGNSQGDFMVETVLTLRSDNEEVSEIAECNWSSTDKLIAKCSVAEGGGGFAIQVVERGAGLTDLKWQVVIGEGLSVGYRAGSTERGDGKRLDYIIRIKGREPVVAPMEIR